MKGVKNDITGKLFRVNQIRYELITLVVSFCKCHI